MGKWELIDKDIVRGRGMEGNGYETRQISLLQVFVRFFGLDRAQNT